MLTFKLDFTHMMLNQFNIIIDPINVLSVAGSKNHKPMLHSK